MPPPSSSTATYFVTSSTWQRRRLFQHTEAAQVFVDTLQRYRREGYYKLYAFVVMPDHVHLLIAPSGITVERAMGLVKGGFSHAIQSGFPVWQKGFHERRMRDVEEFLARKRYIHENPVLAGLVQSAEDYPFSSAFSHSSRSG